MNPNIQEPEEDAKANELCYVCAKLNPPDMAFCKHCLAPLRATSNIDPVKSIWGENGFLIQRATLGQPATFWKYAMAVLLAGLFIVVLLATLDELSSGRSWTKWLNIFLVVGTGWYIYAVLSKMLGRR